MHAPHRAVFALALALAAASCSHGRVRHGDTEGLSLRGGLVTRADEFLIGETSYGSLPARATVEIHADGVHVNSERCSPLNE